MGWGVGEGEFISRTREVEIAAAVARTGHLAVRDDATNYSATVLFFAAPDARSRVCSLRSKTSKPDDVSGSPSL